MEQESRRLAERIDALTVETKQIQSEIKVFIIVVSFMEIENCYVFFFFIIASAGGDETTERWSVPSAGCVPRKGVGLQ